MLTPLHRTASLFCADDAAGYLPSAVITAPKAAACDAADSPLDSLPVAAITASEAAACVVAVPPPAAVIAAPPAPTAEASTPAAPLNFIMAARVRNYCQYQRAVCGQDERTLRVDASRIGGFSAGHGARTSLAQVRVSA